MSPRLLIVEDDAMLGRMLAWELAERGYQVEASETCAAALSAARHSPFDLALIDYQLPDGDGIALLEALRGLQPSIRVLLCSGSASAETGVLAVGRGAWGFLPKPLDADGLDRTLRAALADGDRYP
jgi:ActR/RegA family two-component response regulator